MNCQYKKCCKTTHSHTNMWQSRVEIKHYFIAFFDRVITFKVLRHKTSIKGGTDMDCVDLFVFMHIFAVHMSPTLNRSSVIQHFERGNVFKIHIKTMFVFYLGLPHMHLVPVFLAKSLVSTRSAICPPYVVSFSFSISPPSLPLFQQFSHTVHST